MLDLRRLRTDFEVVAGAMARRGEDPGLLERARLLDEINRELQARADELRHRVREISRRVGELRRDGTPEQAEALQAESRALGEQEKEVSAEADGVAAQLREVLLSIPNPPAAECPDGAGAEDNVVLRTVGFEPGSYGSHQRVPHWEIGEQLGMLDLERAVKLSGSMFVMYRGPGATLARALVQAALDRNSDLYEEIRPPTLVLTDTMVSTGHLPKFEDEAYHVERDGLWAIPTAEVPLTSLGRDEVLPESELPRRFMAHTSCFRREAGSAGRDTRGLLRVHEFDKVEILAYCTPAQAPEMHAELLARAESMIAELGLAYRVVDLCTGDLGNSAARTFDLEVYAPGVDQWLECSSVSWFTDYQARRGSLRFRPEAEKKAELVHTLNGSALAVPRVWAALVETHRQEDGSVLVPELLRPHMRGIERIRAG